MPPILARHIPAAPVQPHQPGGGSDRVSSAEIWRLTWPQLLMMSFQFLVGLTDVWVAGKIHRDVQAVLGVVVQCQFILLIIGTATANASVAAMSQSLGANLPDRARRYAGSILKIGMLFSLIALGLALAFRGLILHLLQVPAEILPLAEEFWQVFLIVLPSHYLLAMTGAMFRARKSVYVPLFSAFMAFVINAFASTGFGLGWWHLPAFGARGIAYATLVSITSMALFNFFVLVKQGFITRKAFAPLQWEKKALPYLFKVALPAGGMQFSWQLGYMVLFAVVASLPFNSVNALAGMAAGMRVESVLFLPAVAFSMTGSMLVGHCLGAGNKAEAKRVGWRLILAGAGSMTLAAIVLWPFLKDLAAFIAPDPGAQADALVYLRYNLLATPFSVTSMCLGGIMTGAGAAIYTFFVFGAAIWLVRLPLAYIFGHLLWQSADGVFMGMFISQAFQASIILYIFQTRDWARFAMIRRHRR
ncbi:MATE efflux family protein [uncultured delta proteobacterium]|uniref:Multidrug-efflux transporter n=1 Tax=uncultured delta proteobacterium TaxID=34034 RepID=A0A212KDT9_9DELT|nr:MATE efflux family protein [uncultured delta proteobacterium]